MAGTGPWGSNPWGFSISDTSAPNDPIKLLGADVLDKNHIVVLFNVRVKVDSTFLDPSSWVVSPDFPVEKVFTEDGAASCYAIIKTSRTFTAGVEYTITASGIVSEYLIPLSVLSADQQATFYGRRTKIDDTLKSFSKVYAKEDDDPLYYLLSAMALEDERIGGSNKLPSSLPRETSELVNLFGNALVTAGASGSFTEVGDESMIKIQTINVTGSAADYVEFAGLDGDAAGHYRILGTWVIDTGTTLYLRARPNNLDLTTGPLARGNRINAGTASHFDTNENGIHMAALGFTGAGEIDFSMRAKTGTPRGFFSRSAFWNGSTTRQAAIGGTWDDDSTQITSIRIQPENIGGTLQAGEIGVGSSFTLYKVERF